MSDKTPQWKADTLIEQIHQDLLKGDYDVASRRVARIEAALALEKSKTAKMREALKMISNGPAYLSGDVAKSVLAESGEIAPFDPCECGTCIECIKTKEK